jgi:hypothetical protein
LKGVLVTDIWIGDSADPPLETGRDVMRALLLAVLTGLAFAALGVAVLSRPLIFPFVITSAGR